MFCVKCPLSTKQGKAQNQSFIGFTWSAVDIEYSWSSLNNRLDQFVKLSLKDYQRHTRPESYDVNAVDNVMMISFNLSFILLYNIPLYGYLDEESVDHDKRGEHGIVQLLQLVEGHLKKGRFLIWWIIFDNSYRERQHQQSSWTKRRRTCQSICSATDPAVVAAKEQSVENPTCGNKLSGKMPPVKICSVEKSEIGHEKYFGGDSGA